MDREHGKTKHHGGRGGGRGDGKRREGAGPSDNEHGAERAPRKREFDRKSSTGRFVLIVDDKFIDVTFNLFYSILLAIDLVNKEEVVEVLTVLETRSKKVLKLRKIQRLLRLK